MKTIGEGKFEDIANLVTPRFFLTCRDYNTLLLPMKVRIVVPKITLTIRGEAR